MPATVAPIIECRALRYRWPGQRQDCLQLDQFALQPGASVFLHGPSGSGKSTLLALIGGVLPASGGSLRVLGQELTRMSAGARDRFRVDHLGFIFQQFNLIPYLSVLDNVLLPLRFSSLRRHAAAKAGKIEDEAQRLLQRLDIGPALQRRIATELSVGQQQRVAAARALIGAPALVIADEPTSALDSERQQGFIDLLLQQCAASNAALLFVSHDLRLAGHFGQCLALQDINRAAHEEA